MRRVIAIAALSALAAASAAQAETWKPYAKTATGLEWSYDADYSYRDGQSGRIVVMQAVGKPGAEPRMGPSGPGKADGVGFVTALDCKGKTLISLGGYSPKKPLELSANWRTGNVAAAKSAEDKALLDVVCSAADQVATK
ncbi:MAG: hypothetical protein V4514_12205 [Pseudomonadota bacterium]|uniref:hypothetical protein n=1 Tax=Phenylobacterium sp. TaxID=1871053 RepID=UPI0025F486F9|nr:hypothetical protein [Phenylobacterium sp.]MBT9473310.1 hypothetical protein [Phenylobacterium sp.]